MLVEGGSRNRLFSPTLEDCIMHSSKEGVMPKKTIEKLEVEEIEAFNMWVNKQMGILPNQYHHTYEKGDTIIYPEHIRDLIVIDQMVHNKREADRKQQEQEEKRKQRNPLGMNTGRMKGGGGFYGKTIKF